MSNMLLMGLASVLAVAVFALVPGAAQASCVATTTTCPHYYVNGTRLKAGTASTKTNIAWGNITLRGATGLLQGSHVTCHVAAAGTLFNPEPVEASAGEGLFEQYAPFACEQENLCPTGTTSVAFVAENLPWHNVLTEEVAGTVRQETTGVKVDIVCFEGAVLIAERRFVIATAEKGQRPKTVEGAGALHPGLLEYDAGSGELEHELHPGQGVKPEGVLKLLGYNAQELIAAKNP
jgi:hypothetical protein